jgi:hypothetical protein
MNADDVAKIDWGKIAMGIAVAIVFIMQQYHAMKLDEVKASVVPRHELSKTIMDKEDILAALQAITQRLNAMENKNEK